MTLRSAAAMLLYLMTAGLFVAGCAAEPPPAPVEVTPVEADTSPRAGAIGDIIGQAPPASQGSQSVVILEPRDTEVLPVPTDPVVMDQFGRDFIPRLIVLREGQPVLFKNSEDELHTVHVKDDTGESLLNVAMPIRGGEHKHTFSQGGDYAVSCNVHPEMHATILVVRDAYSAIADRNGAFALSGVPAGTYDLVLRRSEEHHTQTVEIVGGRNEIIVDFPSAG